MFRREANFVAAELQLRPLFAPRRKRAHNTDSRRRRIRDRASLD
jgi:hypothetical protein